MTELTSQDIARLRETYDHYVPSDDDEIELVDALPALLDAWEELQAIKAQHECLCGCHDDVACRGCCDEAHMSKREGQ